MKKNRFMKKCIPFFSFRSHGMRQEGLIFVPIVQAGATGLTCMRKREGEWVENRERKKEKKKKSARARRDGVEDPERMDCGGDDDDGGDGVLVDAIVGESGSRGVRF